MHQGNQGFGIVPKDTWRGGARDRAINLPLDTWFTLFKGTCMQNNTVFVNLETYWLHEHTFFNLAKKSLHLMRNSPPHVQLYAAEQRNTLLRRDSDASLSTWKPSLDAFWKFTIENVQ